MSHRRTRTALAAVTLVLSAPLLAACGFNAATDRVYTPAMGANERDASVDVLGAVIVSTEGDSGTFVATFVNNDPTEAATLTGIESAGEPAVQVEVDEIEVPARGAVNLVEETPVEVTGDFDLGQYVPLTLSFETAGGTETVDVKVASVPNSGEFEGLDGEPTAPAETPSAESSDEDSSH